MPACLRACGRSAGIDDVRIADFGLSDFYRPGTNKRTSCGSLSYLAPEVFRYAAVAVP